ncbi:MAG: PBECR2 nuclease fold domain-containing protein [Nanoarchaeota archaeon]
MNFVFEVLDKTSRRIHLSKERWKHIVSKHPYMSSILNDIKNTLTNPDLIINHKFDDSMRNYYAYYKRKDRYLLVSVKYLNGRGYVATSFIARKIIRR